MKQYKATKHSLQKDMRNAYWTYIDNIINYSKEDNKATMRNNQFNSHLPKNPEAQCQTKGPAPFQLCLTSNYQLWCQKTLRQSKTP